MREVRPSDLDALHALWSDPDQMRYYAGVRGRAEAEAWIERNLARFASLGYGSWIVQARDGGAFLGYCGIRPLEDSDREGTEIAWHVAKAWWGRGVATEAALAAREEAFGTFGVERLAALIHPENAASRRVAERIGMDLVQEDAVVEGEPATVYVLERG